MDQAHPILSQFPFQPSADQLKFFTQFYDFLRAPEPDPIYILRGYAGTGKTSCVAAIVKSIKSFNMQVVLLAPTGRAAKVMANYAAKPAYTIHKKIYRKKSALSFDMRMQIAPNLHKNTLFIVDEASMIDDTYNPQMGSSILNDLLNYVFQVGEDGKTKGCKLLLVGDTAQLPPVGSENSPALNAKYLKHEYHFSIWESEMKIVLRQESESGILYNATHIRKLIAKQDNSSLTIPKLKANSFSDLYLMNGIKLVEGLEYAYQKYGMDQTLVVCRSNKSATSYNAQIRARVLYREETITGGDHIMIVKNNYFWLPENPFTAFIANGDMAKVTRVRKTESRYGLTFAELSLEFVDYPELGQVSCKCILDTLSSDSPHLSYEQQKKLYEHLMEDYAHLSKSEQFQAIKADPYYNALQIKFAYAVTCHKAQGGQWEAVFVDQGYLVEDQLNTSFLRWLYTAFTRAKSALFLVNFSAKFFPNQSFDLE
ncbi:MAG: ATP-dependent endonuclease [Pedobacter sp.]|nr:MAG: ATP-dependent endonuclease [Pedobacter sp.]